MIDQPLTPELEVVHLCGRNVREKRAATGRPPCHREEALSRAISRGFDWKYFLRAVGRHGLLPLSYVHLKEVGEDLLPKEWMQPLRSAFLANTARVLAATNQLFGLLDLFERHGILVVPYKGIALSQQLYGSSVLRVISDHDLVVRTDDVAGARQLLIEQGYRSRHPREKNRRFLRKIGYSEEFFSPKGLPIELHWRFTSGDVGFPVGLRDLEANLGELDVNGRTVPAFAEEDLLLLLCVHGAKHRFARLEWITGIAELVRRMDDSRWVSILRRSHEYRMKRTLILGVFLAHRWAEAEAPQWMVEQAEKSVVISGLVHDVHGLLLKDWYVPESAEPWGSLEYDIFHFKLRETLLDRLRFLLHRLTIPSRPEEWKNINIIGRSFPAHALIRPAQLLGRLGPAVWSYLSMKGARPKPRAVPR